MTNELTIPEQFYKSDYNKPLCFTVGDLIKELKKLPMNLPIRNGFENGCILTVFNVSKGEPFLEVGEYDPFEDG